MKRFTLLMMATCLCASSALFAATAFEDTFTVTGGGDINYNYNEAGRQTGSQAPAPYGLWHNAASEPTLVTNAGPTAGKLHISLLDGTETWVGGPNTNFTDSGDFSAEIEFTRLNDLNNWISLAVGKGSVPASPWVTPGVDIIIYPNGSYTIFVDGVASSSYSFTELTYASSPTLKIKFVASQDAFPPTTDAQVSLFINDKPYPIDGKFVFQYTGGFADNYVNFQTYADVDVDNLKVTTPPGNVINTAAWNGDADSAISSTKTYTHAIDCGNSANTTINGVTFTGTAGANSGANWEVKTDTGTILPAVETTQYGLVPNITGQSQFIVTNGIFDLLNVDNPSLTLTGLTPAQQYILTLYSQGFGGPSYAYVATSDGAAITIQDSSANGVLNGERMTYHYTANADGVFSISTTATNQVWGLFAFSNEVIPEPGLIIGCFSLLSLALLRRK